MKRTKRTLITLILAAALCAGIVLPVSAANRCPRQNVVNELKSILRGSASQNDLTSLLLRLARRNGSACPNHTPAAPESTPVETPAETPVEIPVQAPNETPVEIPAERPVETPVETPVQTPAQNTERPAANTSDSGILSQEYAVVELVNQQRAAYGLQPLTISAELCQKARMKSQDMAQNRYFDHNSPTYGSPFDMMRSLGISYRTAGENIAMGYSTPQAVMQGWMNSEGHRANILNASFTTIGVGYVANGNYWTQWFIG